MSVFRWLAFKISQHIWAWAYDDGDHDFWLYHSAMWTAKYAPTTHAQPIKKVE